MQWKIRHNCRGSLSIQDVQTGDMIYVSDPPGVCPLSAANAKLLQLAVEAYTPSSMLVAKCDSRD